MVRPWTPALRVEVNSVDVTERLSANLISFSYNDYEKDDSDSLSFTLVNSPTFALPSRGDPVAAWLGWKEKGLRFLGRFTVDEISVALASGGSPATMTISAKTVDFSKGREKVKKSRQWEKISLSDMLGKIAAEHGCGAKVLGASVFYPSVAQSNESDLHLLRRLCAEAGLRFVIKDRTFVVFAPGTDLRGTAKLAASEVTTGTFTFADRGKYGAVVAKWWDPEKAAEQTIKTGAGSPIYTIRKPFQSSAQAQTAAQNHLAVLQRGEIEGNLTLQGREDIFAGTIITLVGFAPSIINGEYIATNCNHSVSKSSGFGTTLKLETIPKRN